MVFFVLDLFKQINEQLHGEWATYAFRRRIEDVKRVFPQALEDIIAQEKHLLLRVSILPRERGEHLYLHPLRSRIEDMSLG